MIFIIIALILAATLYATRASWLPEKTPPLGDTTPSDEGKPTRNDKR